MKAYASSLESEIQQLQSKLSQERDNRLLQRARERESDRENLQMEVKHEVERLQVEAATYLDRLALAQQQVVLLHPFVS